MRNDDAPVASVVAQAKTVNAFVRDPSALEVIIARAATDRSMTVGHEPPDFLLVVSLRAWLRLLVYSHSLNICFRIGGSASVFRNDCAGGVGQRQAISCSGQVEDITIETA